MKYIFDKDTKTMYTVIEITESNCDDCFVKVRLTGIFMPIWVLCFRQCYYIGNEIFQTDSSERKYYRAYLHDNVLAVSRTNECMMLYDDEK